MKSGIELIAEERKRQIEQEGYTAEHDDRHENGELAMAAACYATPARIYTMCGDDDKTVLEDPFPFTWRYDKRRDYGHSHEEDDGDEFILNIPDPRDYTDAEQLDLLIKAGALIVAEIDRLQRAAALNRGTSDL
jgi:hypothetical protein